MSFADSELPPCAVISTPQQWRRWLIPLPPLFFPPPPSELFVAGKFNVVYYWLQFDAYCRSDHSTWPIHPMTCLLDIRYRCPSLTFFLYWTATVQCILHGRSFGTARFGWRTFRCHIWCVAAFAGPGNWIRRRWRRRWRHSVTTKAVDRRATSIDTRGPQRCVACWQNLWKEPANCPRRAILTRLCRTSNIRAIAKTELGQRIKDAPPPPSPKGRQNDSDECRSLTFVIAFDALNCVVCYFNFIASIDGTAASIKTRLGKSDDPKPRSSCCAGEYSQIVTRSPKYRYINTTLTDGMLSLFVISYNRSLVTVDTHLFLDRDYWLINNTNKCTALGFLRRAS